MASGLMERIRADLAERRRARRCANDHHGNAVAFVKTYYHRYRHKPAALRSADISPEAARAPNPDSTAPWYVCKLEYPLLYGVAHGGRARSSW